MAEPNMPVPEDDVDKLVLTFCKAKSGLQTGVRAATTAVLGLDDYFEKGLPHGVEEAAITLLLALPQQVRPQRFAERHRVDMATR